MAATRRYVSASRTYPANVISPAIVKRAQATFSRLAKRDARFAKTARGRHFLDNNGGKWEQYGPRRFGLEPGVISFSGATNVTASRTVAIVADPDCTASKCRVWAGASGGGVWRTDNALASNPTWKQLEPGASSTRTRSARSCSIPTDKKHDTIYLGTGEGNRCSSGCEAGVGIYKSTNGGKHWKKLDDTCVSNATYACVNPGKDAFLGRGINAIVIDPRDAKHIFVGSAQAVRGLSHVIGNGGTTRLEPGANEPGLYESIDGGKTFTEVWNGASQTRAASFGVTDVGLDPLEPGRRLRVRVRRGCCGGATRERPRRRSSQVFAPQFTRAAGSTGRCSR